jgi:hypothetical protein
MDASIRIKIIGFYSFKVTFPSPALEEPFGTDFEPENALFIFGILNAVKGARHLRTKNLRSFLQGTCALVPGMHVIENYGEEYKDNKADQRPAQVFDQTRMHRYDFS